MRSVCGFDKPFIVSLAVSHPTNIYLASSICCRTGNRLSFGKYAFRYDAVVVFDVIPLTGPAAATMFFIPSEQGIGTHARLGSVTIRRQNEVPANLGIDRK